MCAAARISVAQLARRSRLRRHVIDCRMAQMSAAQPALGLLPRLTRLQRHGLVPSRTPMQDSFGAASVGGYGRATGSDWPGDDSASTTWASSTNTALPSLKRKHSFTSSQMQTQLHLLSNANTTSPPLLPWARPDAQMAGRKESSMPSRLSLVVLNLGDIDPHFHGSTLQGRRLRNAYTII